MCYFYFPHLIVELFWRCTIFCLSFQNNYNKAMLFVGGYSCLIYIICVCLGIVVSNTYCVVFLFCLSSSCVPFVAGFSSLFNFDYHFGIFSYVYCAPMLWFNTSINSQKVDNIMRCPLGLVWLIIISLWFSVNWSPLSDRTNVNKGGKLIHYSLQGVHCRYYFMQDNVFR